jgi:HSP20 family protein
MTLYLTPYGRFTRQRMLDRMLQDLGYDEQPERDVVFPVDVKAEQDAFVVTALLPGIKSEDLDIQIVNETLTIQGRLDHGRKEEDTYLLRERPAGNFSRVLTLPATLDPKGAEANLENGVLTLRVPKAETARPKSIKVIAK